MVPPQSHRVAARTGKAPLRSDRHGTSCSVPRHRSIAGLVASELASGMRAPVESRSSSSTQMTNSPFARISAELRVIADPSGLGLASTTTRVVLLPRGRLWQLGKPVPYVKLDEPLPFSILLLQQAAVHSRQPLRPDTGGYHADQGHQSTAFIRGSDRTYNSRRRRARPRRSAVDRHEVPADTTT